MKREGRSRRAGKDLSSLEMNSIAAGGAVPPKAGQCIDKNYRLTKETSLLAQETRTTFTRLADGYPAKDQRRGRGGNIRDGHAIV